MRWRTLPLLLALLGGCNAGSSDFVEVVNRINEEGAYVAARNKAVVDCAKEDFRNVGPVVRAIALAALGDEPGPVPATVQLADGGLLDLEVEGMDGTGLVEGVPVEIAFTWLAAGEPRTGRLTLAREADGSLLVSGTFAFRRACQLFKLTGLGMRLDPDLLPAFRPTGSAELYAVADDLLVELAGEVTFDGSGRAVVEGFVRQNGVHGADFLAALE